MLTWSGEVEEGAQLRPWVLRATVGIRIQSSVSWIRFFGGANLPEFVKAEAQFLLLLL